MSASGPAMSASGRAESRSAPVVPRLLALLGVVVGGTLSSLRLAGPGLSDSFHYGEYFVSDIALRDGAPYGQPLTIHGGLDYLPADLARHMFGSGSYMFPTAVLMCLMSVVAAFLGTELLRVLLPPAAVRPLPFLVAGILSGACLGYRDLLLIAGVLAFVGYRRSARPRVWVVVTGVLVPLGLAWSWNRGLIGCAAVGGGLGLSALVPPRNRSAWLGIGSAVLAALSLVAIGGPFAPKAVAASLRAALAGRENWVLPWDGTTIVNALGVSLAVALAGLSLVRLRRVRREAWGTPDLWIFSVATLGMAKTAFDRIDVEHALPALALPLLLAAVMAASTERHARDHSPAVTTAMLAAGALLATGWFALPLRRTEIVVLAACLAWLACARAVDPEVPRRSRQASGPLVGVLVALLALNAISTRSLFGWIGELTHPPDNDAAVPSEVRWASSMLRSQHVSCVADFTNSGLINASADLPACTRYGYLIYATSSQQTQLIADLSSADPSAVVISSAEWQFDIDGVSMPQRYPRLAAWLDEQYPTRSCDDGFCIASRDR